MEERSNFLSVRWCNFCNSAPAIGKLEAILTKGGEPEMFDICKKCLNDIPEDRWENEGGARMGL